MLRAHCFPTTTTTTTTTSNQLLNILIFFSYHEEKSYPGTLEENVGRHSVHSPPEKCRYVLYEDDDDVVGSWNGPSHQNKLFACHCLLITFVVLSSHRDFPKACCLGERPYVFVTPIVPALAGVLNFCCCCCCCCCWSDRIPWPYFCVMAVANLPSDPTPQKKKTHRLDKISETPPIHRHNPRTTRRAAIPTTLPSAPALGSLHVCVALYINIFSFCVIR